MVSSVDQRALILGSYVSMNGDGIAEAVISAYGRLPSKGKPLIRSNGVREWTVLAGVVIAHAGRLECVALATGVKANPESKIANCQGRILHDCHAEILAIRAFNLYLVQSRIDPSSIAHVYLYVCAPPCGDASMSLLNGGPSWETEKAGKMAPITTLDQHAITHSPPSTRPTQPTSNTSPITCTTPCTKPCTTPCTPCTTTPPNAPTGMLRGRAHFNRVGSIRTKPGRGDSNLTMSKSCSDKLCLRQTRGILLAPLRQLLDCELYIDTLVCPVLPDFDRAFSRWEPKKRFDWLDTGVRFPDYHPEEGAPSPCSLVWTPHSCEIIANGVKQGSSTPSIVSRLMLFKACYAADPTRFSGIRNYRELKTGNTWPKDWIRTAEDYFSVEL